MLNLQRLYNITCASLHNYCSYGKRSMHKTFVVFNKFLGEGMLKRVCIPKTENSFHHLLKSVSGGFIILWKLHSINKDKGHYELWTAWPLGGKVLLKVCQWHHKLYLMTEIITKPHWAHSCLSVEQEKALISLILTAAKLPGPLLQLWNV